MSEYDGQHSKTAQWYALVNEAQHHIGLQLPEKIENYLVLTLDHFTTESALASNVLSIDYLSALTLSGQLGANRVRAVGDQCLLLSGLFPERALRKNVSLDYFIDLGKEAYHTIAILEKPHRLDPDLFKNLCFHFVGLLDVLNAMRQQH